MLKMSYHDVALFQILQNKNQVFPFFRERIFRIDCGMYFNKALWQ